MKIRDKVLSVDDSKLEKMSVPEWDCDIWLKTMTAKQRDIMLRANDKHDTESAKAAMWLVTCVCEEDGTPAFTEDDVDALRDKSVSVLEKILIKILDLNGINANSVEDAEKN